MGYKQDIFKDGILIESIDTRTPQEILDEELRVVYSHRRVAYGSVEDQLDMIYWDQVNGTTTFKDHIAAGKAAHPKP